MTLDELKEKVGMEIGVSDWHLVAQGRINAFAETTEDFQYIHVDAERAATTPFGGTIAHGFLQLSLLSVLLSEAVGEIGGSNMLMNYGFESVRFISPVRSGKRVRGRFVLKECVERKTGQWKITLESTVEIEDEDKPALVAEWLVLAMSETPRE